VTMGTLGDRVGRRRLLLARRRRVRRLLIAARGLLGIAGAMLAPSTLSLIRSMFLDARQRTLAIGVCSLVAVRRDGQWSIVHVQLSILGSPPGR
jgi:hypothetical protein